MLAFAEVKTAVLSRYIDNSVLEEIKAFMGEEGESTINELITIYLANTPATIAKIKSDMLANNLEALKAHVHGLKGSSASIGVVGISGICKSIEEMIRNGKIDEVPGLYDQIEKVYAKVEMELKEKL